eukprot:53926_1
MATNESIRVIARFRPSFESEQKSQKTRKIDIQVTSKLLLLRGKYYSFDEIMDEKTKQVEAFAKIAQPICDGILKGYNGAIIAYGQSGSGKSYTMYGPEDKTKSMNPELVGIIPRSCCYIFQILKNKHHTLVEGMLSYDVKCEFLEIQCNQLKDLLNLNNTPQIKERCVNRQKDEWKMFTTNSEKVAVKNYNELLKYLHYALKLNGRSSRSHMIMNLHVKIHMPHSEKTSVFRFFDLEGSEKMKEPLLKVIKAYVAKQEARFIDTELTYLLKNSFGGNCKTALIVCCSPDLSHINESIGSLKFGVECRTIQNCPKPNKQLKQHSLVIEHKKQRERIKDLEKQIESLKDPNQEYVNIYNEYDTRMIQELHKNIKTQSKQIEQLGEEKRIMDNGIEKYDKDCKRLEGKNNELIINLEEKDEEIQRLKNINKELMTESKQFKQTNEMLNVSNERLETDKQEQLNEINKLKTEVIQQKNLQNRWEMEMDNNKSQIIESLKVQLNGKNEELIESQNNLKEKQNNIYELQDEIRNVNRRWKDEKNKLEMTNEKLLSDIEKHLMDIIKQKNLFWEQKTQIKELLLGVETKTNELELMNNTIEQMKKQNETELNSYKYKLGNMTESNKQLEEEKKMIWIQSNELQKYYYEVVQQQIEADHKLASELQKKEVIESKKRQSQNKGGYIDSDDETNDNSIQITPGMATEIVKKFAHDDVKHDEINDDNHVEHNGKG